MDVVTPPHMLGVRLPLRITLRDLLGTELVTQMILLESQNILQMCANKPIVQPPGSQNLRVLTY